MNWRIRVIKYITLLVVLVLFLNPETAHLGLFIDAVGVDILLLLLEVQFLVVAIAVYNHSIKPVVAMLIGLTGLSRLRMSGIYAKYAGNPGLVLTGEATLMHLLVTSAAVSMLYNLVH